MGTTGAMLNLPELRLWSRASIRPAITGASVLALHMLVGLALRREEAGHLFQAEQDAPSVLFILPAVVERSSALLPIPEPLMRAPPPPKLTTPSVEVPSSPLDVMAVTIASVDRSDAVGNDQLRGAGQSEGVDASVRCIHGDAARHAVEAEGRRSLGIPCDQSAQWLSPEEANDLH